MIFEQLNELKYEAQNGKTYIIYFLKFWNDQDKRDDYVAKYQITSSERNFVWYGRISKERFIDDLKLPTKAIRRMSAQELEQRIQEHVKELLVHVIKKGLDKGFEEANTEFVFYKKPSITKRVWNG